MGYTLGFDGNKFLSIATYGAAMVTRTLSWRIPAVHWTGAYGKARLPHRPSARKADAGKYSALSPCPCLGYPLFLWLTEIDLQNRFRTLRYQSQALRLHCRRSNRRFTNLLEKLCTGHKQMPNERLGFTTADEELSHRLRLRVNHWTHSVFFSEMRRKICPILPPDFLT